MVLNPGITKTVQLLNDAGFVTCDSGDGETHDFECDRKQGYVVVSLTRCQGLVKACHKIADLLKENGVPVGVDLESTRINGNYDPVDEITIIDIDNIHDRMLNKEEEEK